MLQEIMLSELCVGGGEVASAICKGKKQEKVANWKFVTSLKISSHWSPIIFLLTDIWVVSDLQELLFFFL